MITVVTVNPANASTNVYLDQTIIIQFSKQLATQYIDPEYIKLYRVYKDAGVDKYEQVNTIITALADNKISIKPAITLLANQNYTVLIRGDLNLSDGIPSGIRSTDNDVLNGNYLTLFTTGSSLNPVQENTVPSYDVSVDDGIPVVVPVSGVTLSIINTSIHDLDYGVYSLESFNVEFSEHPIIPNIRAISIENRSLDPRYISRVPLSVSGILVSGSIAYVTFNGTVCISGFVYTSGNCHELPPNHEYEFTIVKDYLLGESGAGLPKSIKIQFTSELIPMYCDPYDVRESTLGYVTDDIPDYLIAKMIHTNSKYIAKEYGINYYDDTITIPAMTYDKLHRYAVCKTGYDLLRSPLVGRSVPGGRITSKTLGDLSLGYDYGNTLPPIEDLKADLKECFENSAYVNSTGIGIKSGGDPYYPGRRRDIHRVYNEYNSSDVIPPDPTVG